MRKGQRNNGLSHKNSTSTTPIDAIYHLEFYWNYLIVIRNNSNATAYGLSIELENDIFNFMDTINSLEPLLPNEKLNLKAHINKQFEVKGSESKRILSENPMDNINNLVIKSIYKNDEQNSFISEFKVYERVQINKIIV